MLGSMEQIVLDMRNRSSRSRRRKQFSDASGSETGEQPLPDVNEPVGEKREPHCIGRNSPARARRRAKLPSVVEAMDSTGHVLLYPRQDRKSFPVPNFEPLVKGKENEKEKEKEKVIETKKNFSSLSDIDTPANTGTSKSSIDYLARSDDLIRPSFGNSEDGSLNKVYGSFNKAKISKGTVISGIISSGEERIIYSSSAETNTKLLSGFGNTWKSMGSIKVLATLLPDEILNDMTKTTRSYETAILFPDVSGYTDLCERYDKTGKGGPSRLTEVLNSFMGSMIQIVLSRNGDVCKFSGDAILCFWKTTSELNLMQIIHLAIDCAVDIQKNCGRFKTDVGVELRVKIAVSAGDALFSIIGTELRKHYIILGHPIFEANQAEKLCEPGDIVVTPNAWKNVGNYLLYSYVHHTDKLHVKVLGFGPLWNSVKPSIKAENTPGNIRATIKNTANLKLDDMKPFVIPTVMKGVENNEPLDYLTEMRQVAITFINLKVDLSVVSFDELISLSDRAYQLITKIVDKMDGTVNKLTLFDKDVAILIVFGLRGFRHELASQIALKCAYSCVLQLKALHMFKSVSAGVATGMAYCGVVGHQMRKEYTVMGQAVNRAARLMCAYTNIVSCDRDTFLHSKMESGHFELLQSKPLKGILSIGPYYEFSLTLRREKIIVDATTYPLLGRSKEMSEFEEFLGRLQQTRRSNVRFMVIYGNARIGKSRLIAKFINIAEKQNTPLADRSSESKKEASEPRPDRLEISFIPLTEDDYKSTYETMRLIFEPALGLSETSSVEERQDKILSKLGDEKDVYLLASLNPVFNVNFDLLQKFLDMNQEEQLNAQKMMKRKLYTKCFPRHRRWLIVIDDAEFIDEESWPLLRWCSTYPHSVLYLLTIGQRKPLSQAAAECLTFMPQKKIILNELEKWYQAGLACQILGVKAIPVELENLIQGFKSSGNPGWLESYLLSLAQSGSLHVAYLTRHEVKNLKLVTPPDDMLTAIKSIEDKKLESATWTHTVGTFEEDLRFGSLASQILPVCILGPRFETGGISTESELTMDMMYVKTMDTLKPLEQLILKVGSALGYTFKRETLKFVIFKDSQADEKALGRAIKKLFEIRILGCAKGDFTSPSTVIVPRRIILSTSLQKDVKCECIGISKIEECQNMPLYASCGYLRFRSPVFKDTVYNLLLDDQKKKYHSSSIDYYRTHTYMCKSCGSNLFDQILGYESQNQLFLVCANSPMHGIRSTKMETKTNFPVPNYLICGSGRRRASLERRRSSIFGGFGYYATELNSFSNVDLSNCQCFQILSSVYSELLDHAEGAGRIDILLEIKLEYAAVSLTSYNIPLTMQLLEDALGILDKMKQDKEYPELCTPFVYGKVYTLMGATRLNMGRPGTSLELLEMALKYMGKAFPKSASKIKLKVAQLSLRRKIAMDVFPDKFVGVVIGNKASSCDLMSECLGLMCHVHMITQQWLSAKLSAMWALNKALASNRHFYGLCTAYTNMMRVAYHYSDLDICERMELCAISLCTKCAKRPMEVYELDAIGHLYKVIFRTRHLRAEIEDAVSIGFKSIKIATTIRSTSLRLELMPDLIFALIQLNRLSEAVSLLQELEFTSMQDSDKSAKTWYFALCLDFQLDTGFTVIPFKNCEDFVREEEESLVVVRDPEAERRLYTSSYLWCIRNDYWEASKPFWKVIKKLATRSANTPSSIYTDLKRLEGMLITLVNRLENRNIQTISAIYTDINNLMKELENSTEIIKLLKPRYLLMKAYYRQIRYHDESSLKILSKAKTLADKMNDKNTSDWINHSRMVWNSTISPIQKDYWREHCRHDNLMDWHEANSNVRREAVMFSLPLPKYI